MRTVITRRTLGISWDDRRIQGCVIRSGIAETTIEKIMLVPRELNQALVPVHRINDDLKSFVQEIGREIETCVTCAPESEVMYRTLLRPFSDRKKIADTIGPEVETLLPAVDSRLLLDFVLLGKDRGGMHIIQALCARTPSVQGLVGVCKDAGLDPEIVDCPSVAVAAGARSLFDLPDDKTIVIVHLGWSETSVAILSGKAIRYLGALPWGFKRFVPAPARKDTADTPVDTFPSGPSGLVDGGEQLKAFFREILIMLEKYGELEGEEVLLSAGYAHLIRDFPKRAEESLGMGILAPALKDVQFEGSMDDLLSGFLSVSLASRGFETTDEVNFRQGELGLTKHMKKLRLYAGPWAKAALALLVIWIFALSLDVILLARTNRDLTRKINAEFISVMPKNTPMMDPVKQMEQYMNRLSGQAGALEGGGSDSPLEILKDISAGIPANLDVTFDTINIDETGITLSGSTNTYNNVEQIQALLAKLPYMKEVKIVSANVDKTDQKVKMKIVCKK
ncbi:MAG TPA: pilus assembly protein PilM [Desulfomonilia bacterium]|nr:pilus assembly protein PilM [Desulfomonilia bacterium]